ncbi:MAG: 6-phosphofructokinase [Campylobacteraceae bacterium]|nr:6-phosphofructokinase [Campylobacteraceae bacterium]
MNIAIMCSGGDAAGMNPAIKSFVENCLKKDIEPYLIYDGFEGLIDGNIKKAFHGDVTGIMHLGGTIIRTSRSKRFYEPKYREMAYNHLKDANIDKIIILAGDGSIKGLDIFAQEYNISFVGIPTTIDNDIYGTDYCLGVDTSLNVIKNALDDIRDTSASSKRAFVVEIMGRDCGYLALITALTSGAEICIIPEIEANLESIEVRLKEELEHGRQYILAIVAEGSHKTEDLTNWLQETLQIETRSLVLGHVQRGGNPTVFDRLMGTEFVSFSIDRLLSNEHVNSVIIYKKSQFEFIDINTVTSNVYTIDPRLLKLVDKLTK